MATLNCSQCGAPVDTTYDKCPYCGCSIEKEIPAAPVPMPTYQQPTYPQPMFQQPMQNAFLEDGINPSWPIKNKTAAALFAIFLGCFGVHKFYLGKTGAGVMYVIMTLTTVLAFVPAILGIIEGITYLTQNDHNFQVKNQVRLR